MDSDKGHFYVPLIVRGKVTRQCPQTTSFEEKGEPKQIRTEVQPNALALGQTGSLQYLRPLHTPAKRREMMHAYWAIQRSGFARVNALCNLPRKKSREVAAHFRADF